MECKCIIRKEQQNWSIHKTFDVHLTVEAGVMGVVSTAFRDYADVRRFASFLDFMPCFQVPLTNYLFVFRILNYLIDIRFSGFKPHWTDALNISRVE